ncbi:hypothetical protein SCATT_37150 [Streptantibioticus cattleyicolor NRRL 8057 = DSM 46488]|uniref:Uncharacterized protein n=1 Tax=Streptantibioticus cattleyicolor (strain ATCC 35852 / DSM 46488 / JCM 4925 / NBRC 14057 / NRRL 8057) TaxID=1003195 RepID=G8X2V4_STREN|nr:hypothetical protein SCATT_37150 [Streptantibioticus cattleyicolor NRRL 8057 = DSM 46488]
MATDRAVMSSTRSRNTFSHSSRKSASGTTSRARALSRSSGPWSTISQRESTTRSVPSRAIRHSAWNADGPQRTYTGASGRSASLASIMAMSSTMTCTSSQYTSDTGTPFHDRTRRSVSTGYISATASAMLSTTPGTSRASGEPVRIQKLTTGRTQGRAGRRPLSPRPEGIVHVRHRVRLQPAAVVGLGILGVRERRAAHLERHVSLHADLDVHAVPVRRHGEDRGNDLARVDGLDAVTEPLPAPLHHTQQGAALGLRHLRHDVPVLSQHGRPVGTPQHVVQPGHGRGRLLVPERWTNRPEGPVQYRRQTRPGVGGVGPWPRRPPGVIRRAAATGGQQGERSNHRTRGNRAIASSA